MDNRSEAAIKRSEIVHGSHEPVDLGRPNTITWTNDLKPLAEGEITRMDGLVQGAFWSLLKDAGYEEW